MINKVSGIIEFNSFHWIAVKITYHTTDRISETFMCHSSMFVNSVNYDQISM